MEREAFWSQQLDGNFAKRTPASWMSQGFKDIIPLFVTVWYADKYTRVRLYEIQ